MCGPVQSSLVNLVYAYVFLVCTRHGHLLTVTHSSLMLVEVNLQLCDKTSVWLPSSGCLHAGVQGLYSVLYIYVLSCSIDSTINQLSTIHLLKQTKTKTITIITTRSQLLVASQLIGSWYRYLFRSCLLPNNPCPADLQHPMEFCGSGNDASASG